MRRHRHHHTDSGVPPTSTIVLLCGLEDQDRTHEAFACGVDGIILKVQPPTVVLAVIEALYAPAKHHSSVEWEGAGRLVLHPTFTKKLESDQQSPAWPDALTERERGITRLVGQGLSNKVIAYPLSISHSTVRHHMTSFSTRSACSICRSSCPRASAPRHVGLAGC